MKIETFSLPDIFTFHFEYLLSQNDVCSLYMFDPKKIVKIIE